MAEWCGEWCDGRVPEDDRPAAHGWLDVGDAQQVYWEEWGHHDGVPALYVHGGPGGSLRNSEYRHRFDLERTRLVGFDQRGCGRSLPHASDASTSLVANTTEHLVGDIEKLRIHLGVESWMVSGTSWGSTLALAYAQVHPQRVLGIVVIAVTTTSRSEVDWITEGMQVVFPEAWDRLAGHAEQSGVGYARGRGRLVEAYADLHESPDPGARDAASQEWALWEDTHVSLATGGIERDPRWHDARLRLAFTRLTTHFWRHDGFCDPPVLARMDRLHGIPGTLVHGRRDVSSPMITAWRLHRGWPDSRLVVDEGDGHGGSSMSRHWRAATDRLVARLQS